MTTSITKIKLKISNAEVDIECNIHNLDEIISHIPKIIESLSGVSTLSSLDKKFSINDKIDFEGATPLLVIYKPTKFASSLFITTLLFAHQVK